MQVAFFLQELCRFLICLFFLNGAAALVGVHHVLELLVLLLSGLAPGILESHRHAVEPCHQAVEGMLDQHQWVVLLGLLLVVVEFLMVCCVFHSLFRAQPFVDLDPNFNPQDKAAQKTGSARRHIADVRCCPRPPPARPEDAVIVPLIRRRYVLVEVKVSIGILQVSISTVAALPEYNIVQTNLTGAVVATVGHKAQAHIRGLCRYRE
mmetsp:Transcript_28082/g.46253  ORF Transcript_28082/g.46253 Transcript_28082/m.46253 type:complete len:208 (-) Transcript_28082:557-1180(-)